MPNTIKKRYARSTRFRKVMSNNLSLQQTRRVDLGTPNVTTTTGALGQFSLAFDRPVIVPSNAAEITGVTNNGIKPTFIELVGPSTVNFHFATVTGANLEVPFEDPSVRDSIGAYMRPGTYTQSD